MNIKYFCPRWGSEELEFTHFAEKVKNDGYDGVEMSFPFEEPEKKEMVKALHENNLLIIAQHWETVDTDFKNHREQFKKRLYNLVSVKPLFINCQTGKDWFSFEQNLELINLASEISRETGVDIFHETHRGKFSFAAHITKTFLEKLPNIRISADFSHWCCVAESELDDQQEALNLAIERAYHIHARIGFPEGPQITDPRAPEWKSTTEKFLEWWKQIIQQRQKEGISEMTITSEFGPYPYMQRLPLTCVPIANQWEVNVYMKDFLKTHLK